MAARTITEMRWRRIRPLAIVSQSDSSVTFAVKRGGFKTVYCFHEHGNYKFDARSRFPFLQ
jgi:hypothetical protein